MSRQPSRIADPRKVNSELFTLTYGALVCQLVKDYENIEDVNKNLDRLGYNIGVRIIEDFLARTNSSRCADMRETAEKVQMACKMYLGINPNVTNWSSGNDEFSLIFDATPFAEFAELPDTCSNLKYANILPGIIRGACEMVQVEVQAWIQQDTLKGDNSTEIRVRFIRKLEDAMPAGED